MALLGNIPQFLFQVVKKLIIRIYWPDCDLFRWEFKKGKIDTYWVECTYDEALSKVLPFLTRKLIIESIRSWMPERKGQFYDKIDTGQFFFLVTKDLDLIKPMPWYYPYSGQWGAYCPFRMIKQVSIKHLDEIPTIIADQVSSDEE